jgi:NAD-dependent DNA ligase
MPVYTDIESMRKWQNVLQENEEVVISEKIHGASARFIYKNGKLYGTFIKMVDPQIG